MQISICWATYNEDFDLCSCQNSSDENDQCWSPHKIIAASEGADRRRRGLDGRTAIPVQRNYEHSTEKVCREWLAHASQKASVFLHSAQLNRRPGPFWRHKTRRNNDINLQEMHPWVANTHTSPYPALRSGRSDCFPGAWPATVG